MRVSPGRRFAINVVTGEVIVGSAWGGWRRAAPVSDGIERGPYMAQRDDILRWFEHYARQLLAGV
jgi:hypothetical protein